MPLSDERLVELSGSRAVPAVGERIAMATELLAARARIAEVEQERDGYSPALAEAQVEAQYQQQRAEQAEAENARLRAALDWLAADELPHRWWVNGAPGQAGASEESASQRYGDGRACDDDCPKCYALAALTPSPKEA